MVPFSVENLPEIILTFFVVFGRVGAAILVLPGFSEHFIFARIRVLFAITFTLVMYPLVAPLLGPIPDQPIPFFIFLLHEIIIGIFLGSLAKIIHLSLSTAGIIISFNSALSNSLMFNPIQGQQSGLIGAFLTILGLVIIFITDLHHLTLSALIESYQFFNSSSRPFIGDMSSMILEVFSKSFILSMKISAPFIFMSLVIYTGMGVMGRLMPQMQAFFVIIPLQILLAFLVLSASLPMIVQLFVTMYTDHYAGFF